MTGTEIMFGIGLGLSAIGTGVAVYGQMEAGAAEANRAAYEAEMMERNAQIQESEAAYIEDRTDYDIALHKRQTARQLGKQRSLLSASGVRLDEGSGLDLLKDTAYTASLDEQVIRHGGELDAWRARTGATNTRNQASLTQWGGEVAESSAGTSAFGSGLMGTSSMAMSTASFFKEK